MISKEEKQNPLGKQTVLSLPLSIFAIQTEVPTKENNEVTQGSQPTKLATMDYMEAGVPIDFMAEENDFEKRFKAVLSELNKQQDAVLFIDEIISIFLVHNFRISFHFFKRITSNKNNKPNNKRT